MRAILTQHRDATEEWRRAMYQDYDRCESSISAMQQAREADSGVLSPFTLNSSDLLYRHSSLKPTYQDEQRAADLSEEPDQTVLDVGPKITTRQSKLEREQRLWKNLTTELHFQVSLLGIRNRSNLLLLDH